MTNDPKVPYILSFFIQSHYNASPFAVNCLQSSPHSSPGTRPTNDISIKFEIRPKFGVL